MSDVPLAQLALSGSTGALDTLFRHFDPSMMRFTSLDPIAASQNLWAYCDNNPHGSYDPDGLEGVDLFGLHLSTRGWGKRFDATVEGMIFGIADAFTFGQYFDDSDREAMVWEQAQKGTARSFAYGHAAGATIYVATAAAATGGYAATVTPGILAAMGSYGAATAITGASLGTGGLLVGGMVGGAVGGAVGGGWLAAVNGGGAMDIFTGSASGAVFGGALGFAGEAGGVGLRHWRMTRTFGGDPFEDRLTYYLSNKLGETVINTQKNRRGFDSISFVGKGDKLQLFINEAKNYSGTAKNFSAVTRNFNNSVKLAEEAIENSSLSRATKDALITQLRSDGGIVRLWGNGARRTTFKAQDLSKIAESSKRMVTTHWIP